MRVEYICMGSATGYGDAARDYILALNQAGIDINITLLDQQFDQRCCPSSYKILRELQLKNSSQEDIQIFHCIPELQRRYVKRMNKRTVGMGIFEASDIPEVWVKILAENSMIVVPSLYCKDNFSRVNLKTEHIPHCFNPSIWNNEVKPLKKHKEFIYLYVGSWRNRKGVHELLKCWQDYFRAGCGAKLIIKTDRPKLALAAINCLDRHEVAPVELDTHVYSEEDMARLYKSADCLVLPSRGEGFGLTGLRAMSVGVPVVSLYVSGIKDYANFLDSFVWSPKEFEKIGCMDRIPQFRNQRWPIINPNILAKYMKLVRQKPDLARERSKVAYGFVHGRFTYKHIGNKFKLALESLS